MATSKTATAKARVVRSKGDLDYRGRGEASIAFKDVSVTLDVSNDDDEVFQDIDISGEVKTLVFDTPALGGGTAELKVIGHRGEELYASGEKAETSEHIITSSLPALAGNVQLKIEVSAGQASDKTFNISFYYK